MDACLIALEHAQRHIELYPSSADNTGTARRSVQHIFTRVLNNLSRSIHVSDTQVALSLLNMDLEVSSDSYHYFGANYSVNYFLAQISNHHQHTAGTSLIPLSTTGVESNGVCIGEENGAGKMVQKNGAERNGAKKMELKKK
eukprot:3482469-Ditylum_brightwellii.AAC.1